MSLRIWGTLLVLGLLAASLWPAGKRPTAKVGAASTTPAHSEPAPLTPTTDRETYPSSTNRNPANTPALDGRVLTIAEAIRQDKYCDESGNYILKEQGNHLALLYTALTIANGNEAPNPCPQALLTRDRQEALKYTESQNTPGCAFTRALILTHQLHGFDKSPDASSDLKIGIQLLDQLYDGDRSNGLYPFFKLGALTTASTPDNDAIATAFGEFLGTTKIENPIVPWMVEFEALGHLNSTAFIYASSVRSAHLVPDYSHGTNAVRKLIREKALSNETEAWVDRWLQRLQQIDDQRIQEPFVILIEAANMVAIAKTFWDSNKLPAPRPEIIKDEYWRDLFNRIAGVRDTINYDINDASCEGTLKRTREHFSEQVAKFQERLSRWQGGQ